MYKSIHEIPTFNYYQCYFGEISYINNSIFDKIRSKKAREKAFNEIKKQVIHYVGQSAIAIDLATRGNLIALMQIMTDARRSLIFASDEQKKRLEKAMKEIGLSSDFDSNCKTIERMISIFERDQQLIPQSDETKELRVIYQISAAISRASNGRDIDIKTMSIGEFMDNTKFIKNGTEH